MIIFGKKSTHIKTEDVVNTCTHCNNAGTTTAYVYSEYVHIFWIPVFPIGKYVSTVCSHCKQVLRTKEMSPALKLAALEVKQKSKTPLRSFAALLLFGGLIGLGGVFAAISGQDTEKYALQPTIGDRYYYEAEDGSYSTMKLSNMSADSLYFFYNNYTVNKKSALRNKDIEKNYDTTESYGHSKIDIAHMLKDETIFQIKR